MSHKLDDVLPNSTVSLKRRELFPEQPNYADDRQVVQWAEWFGREFKMSYDQTEEIRRELDILRHTGVRDEL